MSTTLTRPIAAASPDSVDGVTAADGFLLHAEVSGVADAPVTVVLAHGWAMGTEFWAAQLEALRPLVRVVTFDQRGHGRSGPGFGRAVASIDVLGDDLRAVIEQTTPSGPVVLAGHSMGGMAVLALAARHAEVFESRVAGVALFNTSAGELGDAPFGMPRPLVPLARWIAERVLTAAVDDKPSVRRLRARLNPSGRLARGWVARNLFGRGAPAKAIEAAAELIHACDTRTLGAYGAAFLDYDHASALDRVDRVPTLVVASDADQLIPHPHAERLRAGLPHARVVVKRRGGHLLPMEAPDETTRLLLDLVSRAVPGSVPAGDAPRATADSGGAPNPDHEVVIVGTGFAGLGTAIQLRRNGIEDFLVLEKGDEVGGTWRENTYPGCACDVQSHLYSFSFAPNPAWTRMFAPQGEILDYLRGCADHYGVRPRIRFHTSFAGARYDDASGAWAVSTGAGEEITARNLVLGLGGLHVPSYPDLPGMERFRGTVFHSAQWDHTYDLTGKRVAVIGTGASAIQFVPAIADRVAKLHLFQRTPPWILPKPDREISAAERRRYRRFPLLQKLQRAKIYWLLEGRVLGFAVNPKLMKAAEWVARRHIRRQIPNDPDLRRAVTPDYAMGCKRILISDDYYPSLTQPHVELVTAGIAEVREGSIVGTDGVERPVDAIIYGTGFKVIDALENLDVTGAGGLRLQEAWREGPEAYLGTGIAGFPNLYMLAGPNTGLGHSSQVFMIESQINLMLRAMRLGGAERTVEVRPQAQARFNRGIQDKLKDMVWATGCRSWYLDARGVNRTIWPGFTWRFWLRTRRVSRRDLRLRPVRVAR